VLVKGQLCQLGQFGETAEAVWVFRPVVPSLAAPGHRGEDPQLLRWPLEPSEGYTGRAALSFPEKTLWEEHFDRVSISGLRENALS